jgi:hypothetical protein
LDKAKWQRIISAIFWAHFVVAAASHVFVVLMIGGVVKLLLAVTILGFWEKGLLLGVTFYTAMYAINHVTNSNGFCFLTDLENFYRRQAGMSEVKEFTPRFYKKCRQIGSTVINGVKKLWKRS